MKMALIPIVIGSLRSISKGLVKKLEISEVETIQTLAITQAPVRNHQLTREWKTQERVKRNLIANVGYVVTEMKPSIT